MDVATFLRDLGLKDAAKVTGVLDDLGITSGSEWLLLSDDDLSEALDELKDAKVALGDRNKLRNAKKIVQQQVCRKTEHDAMRLSASLPHKNHGVVPLWHASNACAHVGCRKQFTKPPAKGSETHQPT